MIYIIGHILRTSYSIAQWIFSNIIWFGSIFLNLDNISKYFAIFYKIKRSFSAKKVKQRNHMYQKQKLLLIFSLSRQPLLFSASYSILYLKGVKNTEEHWHWEGRPVLLTCKVDLKVSNKIIDIIWQKNCKSRNLTIFKDFDIFWLFYLFFTWASSRGAFALITVMQNQLDLADMSTKYWR